MLHPLSSRCAVQPLPGSCTLTLCPTPRLSTAFSSSWTIKLVIALYFACLLGIAFVPPLWAALPNSITFPVEQWWRKRWPTRRKIRNIDGGRALLDHEEVPTYKVSNTDL